MKEEMKGKEGKSECAKPPPPPKPNLKNKDFVKWTKAESCRQSDNLISSDWREQNLFNEDERLQKTPLFTPVYDNAPTNMVYLLSGEYGRMWEKERQEWYSKVFVLNPKEKDMSDRKKKIRKQAREAKKAAEISIQERRARRAKELEAKAKAEQEKAEKLKAKLAKSAAKKKPKKHEAKAPTEKAETPAKIESEPKPDGCPKGWTPVELTVQCECSHHKTDKEDGGVTKEETEEKGSGQGESIEAEQSAPEPEKAASPTVCEDYIKQLAAIHQKKDEDAIAGGM